MTIDIALVVVALAITGFAAWRVMTRKPPTPVQEESPAQPQSQRPRPRHFALPPVTIDTAPIKFVPEMVPPIDHRLLAFVASGSRTAAVTPPKRLARGSIPPGYEHAPEHDHVASDLDAQTLASRRRLDHAETRLTSDLDDDAETHTNLPPRR